MKDRRRKNNTDHFKHNHNRAQDALKYLIFFAALIQLITFANGFLHHTLYFFLENLRTGYKAPPLPHQFFFLILVL